MGIEVATLVLTAESAKLRDGTAAMKGLEAQAAKTEAATAKVGAAAVKTGQGAAKSGQAARVLAQQLSQVAQQGAATGNYLGALAIQLPDIAGGLTQGAAGAGAMALRIGGVTLAMSTLLPALSIAAMVALPALQAAFGGGKTAAEKLADATDAAKEAMGRMEAAAKAAAAPIDSLAQRYGLAATEARRFLSTIAEAAALDAMAKVQEQVTALSQSLGLLYLPNKGSPLLSDLGKQMGVTLEQAKAIQAAIADLGRASGTDQIEASAARLHDTLIQVYGSIAAMPPQMREFASATADAAEKALSFRDPIDNALSALSRLFNMDAAGDFLSNAISRVETLASKAWGAAAAVAAAAQKELSDGAARGYGGRPDPQAGASGIAAGQAVARARLQIAAKAAADALKTGGGAAKSALDDATKSAQQLADTLNQPVLSAVDSLSNAFGDFIAGGLQDFKSFAKSILQSFAGMIGDMIAMAAKSKILQSLGMANYDPLSVTGQAASGFGGLGNLLGMGGKAGGGLLSGLGSSFSALKGLMGMPHAVNLNSLVAIANGGTAATGLMAALPAIGTIFAGAALIGSLFKKKTTASGIQGSYGADGFSGSSFTTRKNFFGSSTKTSALDTATSAAIEAQIDATRAQVIDAAKALGLGVSALDAFTGSLKVNTLGMTAEQAAQELAKGIAAIGSSMVGAVADVSAYSKAGEDNLTTLSRLSSSLAAANATMAEFGRTLYASSLTGADAAQKLVDAFGGLETFNAANDAYFRAFYSDAEQVAAQTSALDKEMARLGLTMPTTRDGFRALVDSVDISTESGRALYATLIGMAQAFDAVLPKADALTSALINPTGRTWRNYAAGGDASGIYSVGEAGRELVATGRAKVFNASQTRDIMGGGGTSAEVAALREENRQLLLNVNRTMKESLDLFRRWTENGLPTVTA